jgi:hypothetical protein
VPSLINPYINKLACGSVVIFEWGLTLKGFHFTIHRRAVWHLFNVQFQNHLNHNRWRALLTKDRCLHVQVLELNTSSPKEQLCNCPISELSPQAQINDGRAIKIGSRVRCASDYLNRSLKGCRFQEATTQVTSYLPSFENLTLHLLYLMTG